MSYRTVVLVDSPVGYWPLNEVSGTTAFDNSGNAHNGTYNGGFTLGAIGPGGARAVDLNGSTGYVDMGDNAAFTATNFTAECWVNRDTGTSAYSISKSNTNGEWQIDALSSQAVIFNNASTGYASADGATLTAGLWYHQAMTWDGTTLRLVRNGVQEATDTSFVGTRAGDLADKLMLGRREYAPSPGFLDGKLAHAAFYSSALSVARLAEHYRAALREGVVITHGAYGT